MKVFVKQYRTVGGTVDVNEWCDIKIINEDHEDNDAVIKSVHYMGIYIKKPDYLTVTEMRKEKLNEILYENIVITKTN